ncbi:transglycosylase domain-containing protein [Camelliibacillus cellulosilyticus]|uniref:Transglycosylase domain-containing protein n=1 Tax=Camelliibacillus cellulosilyticus TaxID=2174486 RepID=A0ABV9GN05_9BACL
MSLRPTNWPKHIRRFISILKEKRILKGFRVGYKVFWNLLLIFLCTCFIFTFFGVGAVAGYFASLVKDQPVLSYQTLDKDIHDFAETSTIYFSDNKVLGKLRTDLLRTDVKLHDVSPYFTHALLSTEDDLFYQHPGVVPKSVFRATLQELTNRPVVTGGSTITQQLVKNQILTNEVSFERKAKEILLSLRLERYFNKNDILSAYINIVPFGRNSSGQNIAGIGAAAQGVFGVQPKDLNIPQAAFLAGLPKNPFTYSPFQNSGGLKEDISAGIDRAHVVLKRMRSAGYLTDKQFKDAMAYDYKKHFAKETTPAINSYPYLMTDVRERAKQILAKIAAKEKGYNGDKLEQASKQMGNLRYLTQLLRSQGHQMTLQDTIKQAGYNYNELKKNSDLFKEFMDNAEKQIDHNGYKIYTTINKDIYDKMQKAADDYKGYEPDKVYAPTGKKEKVHYPMEVGSVLINNKTGAIISYVGGRKDKYKWSQVNHATQSERQNGSTMKPLLDYGPAIEHGIIQPSTILIDEPVRFPGGYEPHNYGIVDNGRYHGPETARTALYESHNVPATEVYWLNRQKFDPLDYLKKMGFTSLVYPDNGPIPVGIGGLTLGVSVEENTNAYATFANDGQFVDAYMIEKIVSKDGKTIYQHHSDPVQVFTPQTSYLVIDMLRDVLHHSGGTATDVPGKLNFQGDWFGKTGTSQNWHDSWLVAGNPNVTLGVWTGYDQQVVQTDSGMVSLELDHHNYHTGTSDLWARFANAAYSVEPKLIGTSERFGMPNGIVKRTYCGWTNGPATEECQKAGFVTTDLVYAKYAPNNSGSGFTRGRYVIMNGQKVQALPSTPKEFTKEGVVLNNGYIASRFPYIIDRKSSSQQSNGLITAKSFKPDNKPPAPVRHVVLKNNQLSWSTSPSNDVIGYKIYSGNSVISTVDSTKKAVSVPANGIYTVTAVDITGRESEPSKPVQNKTAKDDSHSPSKGEDHTEADDEQNKKTEH